MVRNTQIRFQGRISSIRAGNDWFDHCSRTPSTLWVLSLLLLLSLPGESFAQSENEENKPKNTNNSTPVFVGDKAKSIGDDGEAEEQNEGNETQSLEGITGEEVASPTGSDAKFAPPTEPGSDIFEIGSDPPKKPEISLPPGSDTDAISTNRSVLAAERVAPSLLGEIDLLNNIYDYEYRTRSRILEKPEAAAFRDLEFKYESKGEFLRNSGYLILDSKKKIQSLSQEIIEINTKGLKSAEAFMGTREKQRVLGNEKALITDVKDLVKLQLAFDTQPMKDLLGMGMDPTKEEVLEKIATERLTEILEEKAALREVENQARLNIEITEKLASFLLASGVSTSSKLAGISLSEIDPNPVRKPATLANSKDYVSNDYVSTEIRETIFDQVKVRYQIHFQLGNVGKFEVLQRGGIDLSDNLGNTP